MPHGYRTIVLDEVDSTNEEAKRLAERGEKGGLWIGARTQTAGRGRRGRAWASRPGNLTATLLLRPALPPAKAAQLSFVAGLAVAETFEALGAASVTLKWPNDVLIAGAKAAGILLESSGPVDGKIEWLAIGFGLNLAWAPQDLPYPATATALAQHIGAAPPSPDDALAVLARGWAGLYDTWWRHGLAPIRAAWLERAHGLGQAIVCRLAESEIEGVFEGLDEEGALILRVGQGLRAISAGEVFFKRNSH